MEMIREGPADERSPKTVRSDADMVVIGGGLAGTCCAITAARHGLRTVLVQDRPVLGGNASSEVRLWVLGATSHMGNNNRWAREGGIVNEILEENLWRNPEGNPVLVDTVILEKAVEEPNLTLLLNTAAHQVVKSGERIERVVAWCSQNSTRYELSAPLFCDASGDGVVGFLAGAAFRMGAESSDEFGEGFAPDAEYGGLLGHSLYFYTRDTGKPVRFCAPSYALEDITSIPRYRQFNTSEHGCQLWWIEFGGRSDTVHETETIKWELWKVVYGVWDWIKNSGEFPEAKTLTLEWVGHIPGKRESRRFEGEVILRQQDLIEQRAWSDIVAHGGWAVDLHPADGVYSERSPCNQWHTKGVYGIPYRAMLSRNVPNLFLAGRIISASHVAFGSTRVMATCAAGGQAIGVAAAVATELQCEPSLLASGEPLDQLQCRLLRAGQHLPGLEVEDPADIAGQARVFATSELALQGLPADGDPLRLDDHWAMLVPARQGAVPALTFHVVASADTELCCELRRAHRPGNFTLDETLASLNLAVPAGASEVLVPFDHSLDRDGFVAVCLLANPAVSVRRSSRRLTGVVSLCHGFDRRVASSSTQEPPGGIGVDRFEFWLPKRRPDGQNLAFDARLPLHTFRARDAIGAPFRPTDLPNAWIAAWDDTAPALTLEWETQREVSSVILHLDPDWDHPMESVLLEHPERVSPFLIEDFRIEVGDGEVLAHHTGNHSGRVEVRLPRPVTTDRITIRADHPPQAPAAVFGVQVLAT